MCRKSEAENFPNSRKAYYVASSKIHGRGLFAARDVKKGERIIEYLGDRISADEADRRGIEYEKTAHETGKGAVYIFEVDDDLYIDGNFDYNDAKYINHACRTNCQAVEENGRIFIETTRDVLKDEEFLYNYGYAFEHFLEHPCKCGFPECCGYIIAECDRPKLKKMLRGRRPKWLKKRPENGSEK